MLLQKVLKGSNDEKLLNLVADMLPKRDAERGPPPIVFHGIQGKNVQSDDSPSWYNKAEAGQVHHKNNLQINFINNKFSWLKEIVLIGI